VGDEDTDVPVEIAAAAAILNGAHSFRSVAYVGTSCRAGPSRLVVSILELLA